MGQQCHCGTIVTVSLWNNRSRVTMEQSQQCHCGTMVRVSPWSNRNSATKEQ